MSTAAPSANLGQWHTWREIQAQPAIWREWFGTINTAGLRNWIASTGVREVWFAGAGTSAYIGDILAAGIEGRGDMHMRSVPSTDLVSRPQAYLTGPRRLVVSFGRSGNSAESLGTLDALDALAPDWPRLNITCNPEGALAQRGPGEVLLLPEACHDRGFAMTSSFTTMLLSALALFDPEFEPRNAIPALADAAEAYLADPAETAMPQRAVFVGAGALTFAARECALKVMELTGGQVPALWDSTLGFRHGPKSFVRGETSVFVLISADPHAARYDRDLVAEMRTQFPKAEVTTIGPGGDIGFDWPDMAAAAALAVLPAQIMGVRWANALGLDVDNPFAGQGTLTRVVDGVRLYKVDS